jgi:RHS repeat-associated protein
MLIHFRNLLKAFDDIGTKLISRHNNDNIITNHYYIGAFEYGNTKALALIYTDEGMVNVSGTTYTYEYHLKDHLGNIRVAFAAGTTTPTQINEYYPFGMVSSTYTNGSTTNKYLYNGKELQDELELDWYDYGARFYDPQIGRWHVVDPAIENDHFEHSPYNYVYNNPIRLLDLYGCDSITVNNEGVVINRTKMDGDHKLYYVNKDGETVALQLNDSDEDQNLLDQLSEGDQGVHFLSDENINWFMEGAGVSDLIGLPLGAAGDLLLLLGSNGADFDFAALHLWDNAVEGETIGSSEEADGTPVFFVPGSGGEKAYNIMDTGNWLWGQAAKKLGESRSSIFIGSQVFALITTGKFDSKADQRAIFDGRNYKVSTQNALKPEFYKNPINGTRPWRH